MRLARIMRYETEGGDTLERIMAYTSPAAGSHENEQKALGDNRAVWERPVLRRLKTNEASKTSMPVDGSHTS